MHILDETSNRSLKKVSSYLTYSEALELRDSLNDLIQTPLNNHAHIPCENYQKEITVCIYDVNKLDGFDERSVKLITKDE